MERGNIFLVSLDPTSGHEQQGTRPVLVISPSAFNRLTKMPVVLPITRGDSFAPQPALPCRWGGGGNQHNGCCAV